MAAFVGYVHVGRLNKAAPAAVPAASFRKLRRDKGLFIRIDIV